MVETTDRELSRLHYLFDNDHPDQVWANLCEIIRDIYPTYDFSRLIRLFGNVADMFYGDYPGYQKVKTPYHDLRHTMDVTMCAVRILHGLHVAGVFVNEDAITISIGAALVHDIGYAQKVGDDAGSGAKYTKTHVDRGIEFMRSYSEEHDWPENWMSLIETALLCTNPALDFSEIKFSSETARWIALVVGTADLVGQMADRSYLEKLLFLYSEFKEANLGDYKSMRDLLSRTSNFYAITQAKLDKEFAQSYRYLEDHFQAWFGTRRNYYIESVRKNIEYLNLIAREVEDGAYLNKLKRRGIVDKAKVLVSTSS